jgi:heme a synthase
MLHRFSQFLAACTVVLLLAGSLVTSTDSGLSVPDWPTSYGWSMFTFPPSMWVGGVRFEHTHRLIASTVGFFTIVLAAWLWRVDPRRWMKRLGVAALAAVIAQGLLGGLTVLLFLPAPVSIAHAGLAEIFFCMTVAIALFTSPGWLNSGHHTVEVANISDNPRGAPPSRAGALASLAEPMALRRLATTTTALIYIQILLGATMRHTGAGLAIPDFPLMFGGLIPSHWDAKIAIHFAHRVGALVVTLAIAATAGHILYHHRDRRELTRPALLIGFLVCVQIALGALTVLSQRDVAINSAHVVCGAVVLATSLVLTLRSWQAEFASAALKQAGLNADAATGDVRLQADPTQRELRLKPDTTNLGARA